MEDLELTVMILALLSPIVMGSIMYYKNRDAKEQDEQIQSLKDTDAAAWRKIDDLRTKHEELKDRINVEHPTRPQMQEYVELSMQIRDQKLDSIEEKLSVLETENKEEFKLLNQKLDSLVAQR